MAKIKITENKLKHIIMESVKKVLNEMTDWELERFCERNPNCGCDCMNCPAFAENYRENNDDYYDEEMYENKNIMKESYDDEDDDDWQYEPGFIWEIYLGDSRDLSSRWSSQTVEDAIGDFEECFVNSNINQYFKKYNNNPNYKTKNGEPYFRVIIKNTETGNIMAKNYGHGWMH